MDIQRPVRVKYFLTHPIQYLVPLLRTLAAVDELDMEVIFATDMGGRGYYDTGFSREISWDVPLLDGYQYCVLTPGGKVRPGMNGARPGEVIKHLDRKKTDVIIVHGWGNYFCLAATLGAVAKGIPVLCRTDVNRFYNPSVFRPVGRVRRTARFFKPTVLSLLFRKIDGFLAVGSLNRGFYLAQGVRAHKIFWAPMSIDTRLFSPGRVSKASREELAKKLGLKPDTFKIIFSGKLVPGKRPRDILEAMGGITRKSDLEAIFIGDGRLKSELMAMAQEKNVVAHFPGFVNQSKLPAYYSLGDLLVLPSDNDAWGLVVNEAMAMGVPAAVSERTGCAPDLVHDGMSGYVFPVGDTRALAQIIDKIAGSSELRQLLRRGAEETAAGFTLDRTVEGYVSAIRAVTGRD